MSSAYGFVDSQLQANLTSLASSGLYLAIYSGAPKVSNGSGGTELTGVGTRPSIGGWSSPLSTSAGVGRWYIDNTGDITYTSAAGSLPGTAGSTLYATCLGICPDNAGSAPIYLAKLPGGPRPIFQGANVFKAGSIKLYALPTY